VATLCTHCGAALKDDAPFCKICGTLVPSHPFSPASASSSAGKSGASAPLRHPLTADNAGLHSAPLARRQDENAAAASAEQNAAPSRQLRSTPKDEPPPWMVQLEVAARNRGKASSGVLSEHKKDAGAGALQSPPEAGPPQAPPLRQAMPERELRVKVWDQAETAAQADDLEDRPTGPLAASLPGLIVQHNMTPAPEREARDARVEELERLDTARLAAQVAPSPLRGPTQPPAGSPPPADVLPPPVPPRTPYYAPFTSPSSGAQPLHDEVMQETRSTPPPQPSVALPRRRKRRKPLLLLLSALVLLLVGGGAVTWVVKYQPFSVAPITKPQQTFSDQRLGLSLLYPSSWQAQIDRTSTAVHFADSSHTVQVNIVVGPAGGGDSSQYVHQEAARLGLTTQKAGPALTFAGATWQQMRGNVQQLGANYGEEVLVTAHNSHFFSIIFLAPQAIFAQEDQAVFSEIRASLQFLA
jgi:hypothetical protein